MTSLAPTADSFGKSWKVLVGCGRLATAVTGIKPRNGPAPSYDLRRDGVGLDFVVEGLAADAEAFGRFQLVAAGFLENLHEKIALHRFHQSEVAISGVAADLGVGDGEVIDVHHFAFAHEHGALDLVLQLTHVARPIVLTQA